MSINPPPPSPSKIVPAVFPQQQSLRERAYMLCDTHIACLVGVARGTMCCHVGVCVSFRKHVYD